jgi:hypothetical protein
VLNIKQLIGYHRASKLFAIGLGLIVSVLLLSARKAHFTLVFTRARIFLLLLPYLWYIFAANHSVIHVWFTYRAQFLTVFVLALSLSDMIDWARVTRVGDACRKRAMIALRRWTSKNLQT